MNVTWIKRKSDGRKDRCSPSFAAKRLAQKDDGGKPLYEPIPLEEAAKLEKERPKSKSEKLFEKGLIPQIVENAGKAESAGPAKTRAVKAPSKKDEDE